MHIFLAAWFPRACYEAELAGWYWFDSWLNNLFALVFIIPWASKWLGLGYVCNHALRLNLVCCGGMRDDDTTQLMLFGSSSSCWTWCSGLWLAGLHGFWHHPPSPPLLLLVSSVFLFLGIKLSNYLRYLPIFCVVDGHLLWFTAFLVSQVNRVAKFLWL